MIDKYPTCTVILSSYNGEKFIREQITSILAQRDVKIDLIIRDDGSTDTTPAIIRQLCEEHKNIHFVQGQNVGVVKSFFELMKLAQKDSDYLAFADQDDFWKPGKLARAHERMKSYSSSAPVMYYSRLEFTDTDLKTIGFSAVPRYSGFHNAVVQNQATGCTVVLNNQAKILVTRNLPAWSLMHDWWCYLVISAFGKIIYDDQSNILYRKHGNNVTPATPWFIVELYARTLRFLGKGKITEKVSDQVAEFKRVFENHLTESQMQIIDGFLGLRHATLFQRVRYTLDMPVRRNTPLDNLILRILIIAGRF